MKNRSMSLAELLAGYAADSDLKHAADGGIVVRGLAIDSREVREGDAFVVRKLSHKSILAITCIYNQSVYGCTYK